MTEMTYVQKMAALTALGRANIQLTVDRKSWACIVPNAELKRGRLSAGLSGWGETPQEAVESCWEEAISGCPLVVGVNSSSRETFRWNGFMWERVREENEE